MQSTQPIREFAHHPRATITTSTTLREAAQVMYREDVGLAVVQSHNGVVLGLLSERDITTALAKGADPDRETVMVDMTRNVISVRPDDTVLDTVLLMLDDGIRHAPVIDEFGRLSGVVSVRDLLRPLVVQAMTPAR